MSHGQKPGEEYDVYKHSLLRYAGYANELGEGKKLRKFYI